MTDTNRNIYVSDAKISVTQPTGTDNLVMGNNTAGREVLSNISGNNNISLGSNSLSSSQNVGDNIGIGFNALRYVTDGGGVGPNSRNIAIGTNALQSATGSSVTSQAHTNVVIGYGAASAVTSGSSNTVVGASGASSLTTGIANTVIGVSANTVPGTISEAVAIGPSSIVSTSRGVSIGYACVATGVSTISIGNSCTASGANSIAVGITGTAYGVGAIAIGSRVFANATGAIAIGKAATGSGQFSIVIGENATTISPLSIAIGRNSFVQEGTQSVAVGAGACVTGSNCIALGAFANAFGTGCIALGPGCSATGTESIGIGIGARGRLGGISIGVDNSAISSTIIIGTRSTGSFGSCVIIGQSCRDIAGPENVTIGNNVSTDVGSFSVAIGSGSKVANHRSVAIGYQALASATGCIAIGPGAQAINQTSIAIGSGIVTNQNGGLFLTRRSTASVFTQATWNGNELVLSTSSQRFKTDIKDYTPDLKSFERIRPVTYKAKPGFGKDMDDHIDYPGFIAEELAEVYPEFVTYEPDGKTILSVAYDKLSVVLVSKLKEQQKTIENLLTRVQALEEFTKINH